MILKRKYWKTIFLRVLNPALPIVAPLPTFMDERMSLWMRSAIGGVAHGGSRVVLSFYS